jgi:hypothetical protein
MSKNREQLAQSMLIEDLDLKIRKALEIHPRSSNEVQLLLIARRIEKELRDSKPGEPVRLQILIDRKKKEEDRGPSDIEVIFANFKNGQWDLQCTYFSKDRPKKHSTNKTAEKALRPFFI